MTWEGQPQKVIVLYIKYIVLCMQFPSSVEHVKFGMNPGRPRSKAKYFFIPIANSTVREWWKEPLVGEWNRSWNSLFTMEWERKRPRTYWRMGQRVTGSGKDKVVIAGSVVKASLKWAI